MVAAIKRRSKQINEPLHVKAQKIIKKKNLKVVKPTKVSKLVKSTRIIKQTVKNGAPVDTYSGLANSFSVYSTPQKTYHTTLNQTNVDRNNNKFYIIQVLKDNNSNIFYAFNRWGRVGEPGQHLKRGPFNNAQMAIKDYEKKLHSKSVLGNYKALDMNFGETETTLVQKNTLIAQPKARASKLSPSIISLVQLIFDTKGIESSIREIGYDSKKMPLGKLGDKTIKLAYKSLNNLLNAIQKKSAKSIISKFNSEFYTLIPHDFGRRNMAHFIMNKESEIQQKLKMLSSLSDMKIVTNIIQQSTDCSVSVIDQNYEKLKCCIEDLEQSEAEFKIIQEFFKNSKQNQNIILKNVFAVERSGETERFNTKLGNEMLLWHGSRVSNFGGILSQGLRIAPPEAPVSGYAYGKGLYFADLLAKSSNYCRAYTSGGDCLVLLCDVALGRQNSYTHGQGGYLNGKDSCLAKGSYEPKSQKAIGNIKVPCGPVTNGPGWGGYSEFIVYNENQVKMNYLLRIEIK